MPAPAQPLLVQALDQTLDQLPASVSALAVALSGGPDSSALAILAAQRARLRGLALHLFHVHHGLFDTADDWAAHAEQLARQLDAPFAFERVTIEAGDARGIEAAARSARYQALGRMARQAGLDHILLGHHLDDQAETVMLRLLRGAGVEGMAAMAPVSRRDDVVYLRPWLRLNRIHILEFMQAHSANGGLGSVQDPSNLDIRFARGALRSDVLPAIERHWPGYRATFERFARLAAESAAVLREVAAADLESVREDQLSFDNCLRVSRLAALSEPRQMMVLRSWFASHGLAMPSEARLQELNRQLKFAAHDRQLLLQHGALRVRRYRDWVIVDRGTAATRLAASPESCSLQWAGEVELRADTFGGGWFSTKSTRASTPHGWGRRRSRCVGGVAAKSSSSTSSPPAAA